MNRKEIVEPVSIELVVTNEKNWPRLTLGDICEIGSSKRVFEKDYVPSGIPFFRTKEIVELSKGNPISTELSGFCGVKLVARKITRKSTEISL